MDASVPQSPGWWLNRLSLELSFKAARLARLDAYARGDAPLVDIAPTVREAYQRFQMRSRTNFAGLAVEAMLNRTQVTGFSTGSDGDSSADADAWRIWQANNLDADSAVLHRACFAMGEAAVIVGDLDPDTGIPVITVEDPRCVVTAMDTVRRHRTRAALKSFIDDWTGDEHAYLYLPGQVWRFMRKAAAPIGNTSRRTPTPVWQWSVVDEKPTRLPFDQVPVVWFPNRLDIDGRRTLGEFEDATDVLDRINTVVLQRLVIGAMQAFRQRALKNLPLVDETGTDIDYEDVFAADPAALWQLPADVDIWESAATDLQPLLSAARDDIRDFAAVTRTPLAYLTPDAANQSAEGASLSREVLTAKVLDRTATLSESWEQVVSLAFRWQGDPRADAVDMETLWAPPQHYSLAERYDAASKGAAAGVPWRYLMSAVIGMSPQELAKAEEERDAEPDPVPVAVPVPVPAADVADLEDPADMADMPDPMAPEDASA